MKTQLTATLIEIGDDEEGNPRLIFQTTREDISAMKSVSLYREVTLTMDTNEQEVAE